MVQARLNVTNGYISQDMADADSNFTVVWPYLQEIETARSGESSLDDRINSAEASVGASVVVAAGHAGDASDYADAAAASATEADGYTTALAGSSTTSVTVGTGSKTFTVESGKKFTAGQFVSIISAADPTNYMHGAVTSYSGTTLIVNVSNVGGSGTFADWGISLSGSQGAKGDTGGSDYRTLLYSVTATAASEVVFEDDIDGTYDKYIIESNDIVGSTFNPLGVRVGTGAGPTYQTTDYRYGSVLTPAAGAEVLTQSLSDSSINIGVNATSELSMLSMLFTNPAESTPSTFIITLAMPYRIDKTIGSWFSSTPITAVKIFGRNAQTITGTFKIYGVS